MAIKEIKQHWIISCDCCGTSKEQTGTHRPSNWVKIHIAKDALDFSGAACADASVERLFCEKCGPRVIDGMEDAAEATLRAALRSQS